MASPKRHKILNALRIAHGYTNEQLAARCGVTTSTVQRWMTGACPDAAARRVLEVLNADARTWTRCGVTP